VLLFFAESKAKDPIRRELDIPTRLAPKSAPTSPPCSEKFIKKREKCTRRGPNLNSQKKAKTKNKKTKQETQGKLSNRRPKLSLKKSSLIKEGTKEFHQRTFADPGPWFASFSAQQLPSQIIGEE